MELEGLVLLSEFMMAVKKALNRSDISVQAYTDSEVALAWVRNNATDNKFVKRRVNKIRQVLAPAEINYVASKENPSDVASRGTNPSGLINHPLWLHGPEWLKEKTLPFTPFKEPVVEQTYAAITTNDREEENINWMDKISSFPRLLRITARILKWKNRSQVKEELTAEDFIRARQAVIKQYQIFNFANEAGKLQQGKALPKKHWLTNLAPFFDERDQCIRVGGRISRADITFDQKFPILLPKNSNLVDIIIKDIHHQNGHCGNSLLESLFRAQYWTPALKLRIKKHIRQCNICIRWKAITPQPQMADLPGDRVNVAPAFAKIGVDFCGPFHIRASKIKFEKIIKVWISVFICLVTKAIHLELCTELTTENFLDAFTRFTSRRGTPTLVMSDNGTNFVGANKQLKTIWTTLAKEAEEKLAIQEILWKFIPPRSPNFGGLWEAAVRSLKFFIKRMDSTRNLTYEEFTTLICRIEGILNSRPLYPVAAEPETTLALTPFQLVTQRQLKNSPHEIFTTTITKKWKQMKEIQTQFWQRFQKEYLHHLQKRTKWIHPTTSLQVGQLVLLKEQSTTPLQWKMGKVIKCYPDDAGNVRQVDIKTSTQDSIRKSATTLVPLLPDVENEAEPALRRSQRTKTRSQSLITSVLLCWLALVNSANGLFIQPLNPGVHLQYLGETYIKSFDLSFTVVTTTNLTEDLNAIDQHVKEFSTFCEEYEVQNFTTLHIYCRNLEKEVEIEANQTKAMIQHNYNLQRPKRSLVAVLGKLVSGSARRSYTLIPSEVKRPKRWIGVVAKGLLKYSPEILMTAGIAYQAYENDKLQNEVEQLKLRTQKVTSLLNEKTDIEYQAMQEEMKQLVEQQRQIMLEGEIGEYANAIQLLVSNIQMKHQNIGNIRPLSELQDYVKQINSPRPSFKIPENLTDEELFTFNPVEKGVKNDLVTMTFMIPMVKPHNFSIYALVSIPSFDGSYIAFGNGKMVQQMGFDPSYRSYFDLETAGLDRGIVHTSINTTASPCIDAIVKKQMEAISQKCEERRVADVKTEVFSLGEDLAITLTKEPSTISVVCDKNESSRLWSYANLIDYKGCKLLAEEKEVTSHMFRTTTTVINTEPESPQETISPPPIIIEDITDDPRVDTLSTQIQQQLSDWEFHDTLYSYWIEIGLFLLVIVLTITGIIVHRKYQEIRKKLRRENWLSQLTPIKR